MAKKAKTEGVLAKETRLRAEADAVAAARRATEAAAEAAKEAAEKNRIEKAERRKKPKRARFVRGKKETTPKVEASPLPGRSTTAAGKLMSRNVTDKPRREPQAGPKPKRVKP